MAGFEPLRRPIGAISDDDDIHDWMAQRSADLAGRQGAEAAGRDAWGQATRSGQDFDAPQPSDLVRLGAQVIGQAAARESHPRPNGFATASSEAEGPIERALPVDPDGPLLTPRRFGFATAKPGDSISKLVGTSDPAAIGRFLSLNGMDGRNSTIYPGRNYATPTQFNDATPNEMAAGDWSLRRDNARLSDLSIQKKAAQAEVDRRVALLNDGRNIWTGESVSSVGPRAPNSRSPADASAPPAWWRNSQLARTTAKALALPAGEVAGAVRGASHAGTAIKDGLKFATRLLNPLDPWMSTPGEAAWDQVAGAATGAVDYARSRSANPALAVNDIRDWAHNENVALNPYATPVAKDDWQETRRLFGIAENQGELLANIAVLPLGGEAGSALEAMEYAGEAGDVGKYLKAGFTEGQAAELAKPYLGIGHHVMPRRTRLPAILGGGPMPSAISNGRLFRLAPEGIDKGQFYGLHYGVDDRFYGTKIPGYGKGQGFSGNRLGLPRYQGLERAWRGTTGYAKGVIGGALMDVGDDIYGASH